jgi:hypothetical protein
MRRAIEDALPATSGLETSQKRANSDRGRHDDPGFMTRSAAAAVLLADRRDDMDRNRP